MEESDRGKIHDMPSQTITYLGFHPASIPLTVLDRLALCVWALRCRRGACRRPLRPLLRRGSGCGGWGRVRRPLPAERLKRRPLDLASKVQARARDAGPESCVVLVLFKL